MRLPKEVIGRVRRGELGVLRRPVNSKPCPFKPGRFYAIEKVETRHEENCRLCAGEGCAECADHGTVIVYEKRATTLDGEFVEIEAVERQPLHWADDDEAEAWGFETREEFIEDWQSENGKNVIDTYLIRFRYAVDLPNMLARHGGYTHADFDALDGEPEAVDRATLDEFSDRARRRFEARMVKQPLDERVRELLDAQARGIDVSRQLSAIERRVEAGERKLPRKAA